MVDRTSVPEPEWPATLERRFEGVVLIGARLTAAPEIRPVVEELLAAAMPVALVSSDTPVAEVGSWGATLIVTDDPHVALSELWRRGVTADSTLVVAEGPERTVPDDDTVPADTVPDDDPPRGEDPLPSDPVIVRIDQPPRWAEHHTVHLQGGLAQALRLLTDQRDRRRREELPLPASTSGWTVTIVGFDPEQERVRSALLTLADGLVGWSGAPSVAHPSAPPSVVHIGVYDGGDGADTHLLEGPVPATQSADLLDGSSVHRVLDLRTGVLGEEFRTGSTSVRSVRFSPLTRPGLLVQRVVVSPPTGVLPERLLGPPPTAETTAGSTGDGAQWIQAAGTPGGMTAAARATESLDGDHATRTQLTAITADASSTPAPDLALDRLPDDHPALFDRLLDEHRAEFARRWADADMTVEGDDELQVALRFAIFHLMGAAGDTGEAAVGARGLTGTGYRGHVFWDADAFTLPFFAATHPASARAMLEYRLRRLPAALDVARKIGRKGAKFPWESARTGLEVTPPSARDRAGHLVPIRTGLLEDHIVADVAWAAQCYVDWTGDEAFADGVGLPLFVETARYWASRVRVDADGLAHIYGVIGPDEYHEPVDDNAFTNVMARWNLRRAAALTAPGSGGDGDEVSAEERHGWLDLADALIDGYDPDTGIYEQCAGFFRLEPLIIEEVVPRRPIAADLLLGAQRVRASQVLKQADVLMLHHLVPDEVVPGTLEPNLRFYEPRTAHGSSLSPAIHAALHARARDYERAMQALHIASRIDLDDLTGSTSGGLHIATMGGLWQAMVWGFAGMRPREGRLGIDPLLPPGWTALEVNVRYRGSRVTVRREGWELLVRAEAVVPVLIDGSPFDVGPAGLSFTRRRNTWEQDR